MAFGYEYLMVYLPEICSTSFLLFVHNPAGSTKLRDYSSGSERCLSDRVAITEVLRRTETGRTRFYYDPHRTDGIGVGRWVQVTRELNRRWLAVESQPSDIAWRAASPPRVAATPAGTRNRAVRGSRRQLQDYVNGCAGALAEAILAALPPRLAEVGATIRWTSPLAGCDYEEYRDAAFLSALEIQGRDGLLADFWPAMGPSWDALGILSDPGSRLKPGAILVEAKSHIREIYGNGCQAAGASLGMIEHSLSETKAWLGARVDANWIGPLYQYANRLAHLSFLLKKTGTPAWLVSLYFLDDPIGPTSEEQWRAEIAAIKASLGLPGTVPNAVDVFLPAIAAGTDSPPAVAAPSGAFRSWSQAWLELGSYPGVALTNARERIDTILKLWREPIAGVFERTAADLPGRLLAGPRYTRGDIDALRIGEHAIEHEVLCRQFDTLTVDGARLVDGVNAFPLVRDAAGGRNGNVEADLLLLLQDASGFRALAAEVKDAASNAWYAAVENLRQLRLIRESGVPRELFARRNPSIELPRLLPIAGAVIAPPAFYTSDGQKASAVQPAHQLLAAVPADVRLMVWDAFRPALTTLR